MAEPKKNESAEQAPERRILALMDSPTVSSGFGIVARNVLKELEKTGKYLIDVIGINHFGDFYNTETYPYRIYPAMPQGYNDLYGRPRLVQSLLGHDLWVKGPWDFVFTLQDSFILETVAPTIASLRQQYKEKLPPEWLFQWIGYWPVDAELKENWVTNSIAKANFPVAYTEYGKREMVKIDDFRNPPGELGMKDKVRVIPHGVDSSVFHPLPEAERKEFRRHFFQKLGVTDNTFVVTNVNRNQPRKDLARTMLAFREFKKRRPDSILYLHAKVQDAGGSLQEIARAVGLEANKDWSVPNDFNENQGYPIEMINQIYNAADLVVSTTLGEGWGLSLTEAMAAGKPVLAPAITSIPEMFGMSPDDPKQPELAWVEENLAKLRGIPVKSGSSASEFICLGLQDNERLRPLTNVDDMVAKMIWAYDNPDKAAKVASNGYKWVTEDLPWSNVCQSWVKLFDEAWDKLQVERSYITAERNKAARKAKVAEFRRGS